VWLFDSHTRHGGNRDIDYIYVYIYIYICMYISYIIIYIYVHIHMSQAVCTCTQDFVCEPHDMHSFLDGYCSTLQGLLDWFEVDLRFTKLLFIQTDLCVNPTTRTFLYMYTCIYIHIICHIFARYSAGWFDD